MVLRLWLFLFCFILVVSAASSIITKEYVCKHLKHLFPRQVSYNRFVELEKEVLLSHDHLHQKVLLGTVPASVLSTPLLYVFVVTKESLFIRHLRDLPSVKNVQWDGSSDSSCI